MSRFNGSDYNPAADDHRLTGQIRDIFLFCADGEWYTLGQIESGTGHPQASISAQLRHLRKKKWGSHTVNKRNLGGGLWEYQLIVNENPPEDSAYVDELEEDSGQRAWDF